MRLAKSWLITRKDFKVFRKKRYIIYSLIVPSVLVAIVIPVVMRYAGHRNGGTGIPASELSTLLPAFAFYFVMLAAYLPTAMASYSFVGEKVEKSLEPLLATPTTDGEILLGKGLASFLPPIGSVLGGSVIFMILADLETHAKLGYYYFPNWTTGVLFFILVPLVSIMSVEANVMISSRVSDVRAAQQLGVLMILPFAGLYVCGELDLIQLGSTSNLLVISGTILAADLLLFILARATFRREEILTRWR